MKFAAFQNPAVFDLFDRVFGAKLPVKTAYRLSKIQKVVSAEAQKYQELRVDVIKKYAALDEAGELIVDEHGNIRIDDEKMDDLVKEMTDLHDIEIELPSKINIEELESIELTAYDLSVLEALEILEE